MIRENFFCYYFSSRGCKTQKKALKFIILSLLDYKNCFKTQMQRNFILNKTFIPKLYFAIIQFQKFLVFFPTRQQNRKNLFSTLNFFKTKHNFLGGKLRKSEKSFRTTFSSNLIFFFAIFH